MLVPLVGWYEPLGDRALLYRSQVGAAVVEGFGNAARAIERLSERSRWRGLWFVVRGTPKSRPTTDQAPSVSA